MRKKHGTVRTAVRPFGSVNRDRFGQFGRFGLFQPLNNVVQPFLFFFPPIRRRSETLSQNHSQPHFETLSQSSSTLTRLYLSQKSLSILTLSSLNHSLVVASLPRATALSQLNLSPSRRRTVAAQSLRHSLVAASLPRRHRSAAQIAAPSSPSQLNPGILFMVLPIPKIQSCSKHFFSSFFWSFFFLGMNFQKFLCVAMSFAYLGCYFVYGSNL